jgi:signal transduction histidine kinase
MATRTRPVRTRPLRLTLVGLLLVPLVSLTALWVYSASLTLGSALRERNFDAAVSHNANSSDALSNQLSVERVATYSFLSAPRRLPVSELAPVRKKTDAIIAAYEHAIAGVRSQQTSTQIAAQDKVNAALGKITSIRADVDAGTLDAPGAFQAYSGIVDTLFADYSVSITVDDVSVYKQTVAIIDAVRALEQVGREVALVGGAAAAHGRMSNADRVLFAEAVATQRTLIGDALSAFGPELHQRWAAVYDTPTYHRFADLENRIAASGGGRAGLPVSFTTWHTVSSAFLGDMQAAALAGAGSVASAAGHVANHLLLEGALAGGLGLVAVVASVLLAIWFARRLTRDLTGLHDSAQSMAQERLPSVVDRLRAGEDVDAGAESPPPGPGRITEIAKVAEAFDTVQRTAVEAAVGQANLRKGVNQVFLNLSLRNQSLLHRQLGMLDTMERAARDPDALADLFRLDHLTTRMRRHAESLIILSGATPGRGWREPVPVVDVLRAAVAEVEDYVRVEVITDSRDAIAGGAVNDVIHLVAELVENATSFSPPNTTVEVKADAVGIGFAVEVEDRGLGLTEEELDRINDRLARPPEFDLANSDQLGLFVVGQLAARHGIKVSLRESPYGGIRAIALFPRSIIVSADQPGGAAGGVPSATGRVVPEDSTGPLPSLAGEMLTNRERATVFSMTGRHRLGEEPHGDLAGIESAGAADLAPQAAGEHAGQAPADSGLWSDTAWPAETPWQDAPAAAAAQAAGAPAAVPQPPAEPDDDATYLGLPRRVRQASLAPQLKSGSAGEADTGAIPAVAPGPRSPEQTRSLMTALQEGWRHGRIDDLDHPVGGPGGPAGGTATDGEVLLWRRRPQPDSSAGCSTASSAPSRRSARP